MTNWQQLRQQILDRDSYTCQSCFKDAEDIHHIIPRRLGGLDSTNNLVSVCQKCHLTLEWRTRIEGMKMTLRLPADIAKELKYKAIEENTSVNALAIKAFENLIGSKK